MKRLLIMAVVCGAVTLLPQASAARLRVVASTADLAYLASQVGGEHVDIDRIASPRADAHYIEVRPSFMVKVGKADVALKIGLEMDQWMDRIIDGSRNGRLEIVDCSKYIEPLQVPTFKVDARYGDLHRFGNPHYWLSPDNLAPITQAIVEGFAMVDPAHTQDYMARRDAFLAEVEAHLADLAEQARPLAGLEVVFYHNSWPYFNAFVGTVAVGFVEPYPGVPPSPSHVAKTIELIRRREIQVIAMEPYFDRRVPEKIASETGATVVTLYPSVGGRDKDESYVEWLSGNIEALKEAIR